MKMKVMLAMLLCSHTLTSIVLAEEQPRVISVQGSATIATAPDAFSVTFVIEQKGESVSTLNQKVSQSTKDIIDLLRGMSVDEKIYKQCKYSLPLGMKGTKRSADKEVTC
jgi:uncharacterized protein YggE